MWPFSVVICNWKLCNGWIKYALAFCGNVASFHCVWVRNKVFIFRLTRSFLAHLVSIHTTKKKKKRERERERTEQCESFVELQFANMTKPVRFLRFRNSRFVFSFFMKIAQNNTTRRINPKPILFRVNRHLIVKLSPSKSWKWNPQFLQRVNSYFPCRFSVNFLCTIRGQTYRGFRVSSFLFPLCRCLFKTILWFSLLLCITFLFSVLKLCNQVWAVQVLAGLPRVLGARNSSLRQREVSTNSLTYSLS